MSGPKTSQAELERQRAAELARKRQEVMEKLRSAQATYQAAVADVRRRSAALSQMAASSGDDSVTQQANAIIKSLTPQDVADAKSPQSYLDSAELTRLRAESATALMEATARKIRVRQAAQAAAVDRAQTRNDIQSVFALSGSALADASGPVSIDFHADSQRNEFGQWARDVAGQLSVLSDQAAFQPLAREVLPRLRAIADGSDAHGTERVWEFLQDTVNRMEEIRRKQESFDRLYADYASLAALTDTKLGAPESFASEKELRQETERLRKRYRELDEMNYIADQIGQTMADLGYQFVTSNVMRKKDASECDCSLYQADERSGVAVFTDQSGAVMMRMTVLGDGPVTDADRDFSYQRQIDFCSAHPEIVEALKARGVLLTQKDYKPPDRKYTYKSAAAHHAGRGGRKGTKGRRHHGTKTGQREKSL